MGAQFYGAAMQKVHYTDFAHVYKHIGAASDQEESATIILYEEE